MPVYLHAFLFVRAAFAIGLGLIAWTFIDLLLVIFAITFPTNAQSIGVSEIIVVRRTHQWIENIIRIRTLLPFLLLAFKLIALLTLSQLSLASEHLFLMLELQLVV